MAVKKNRDLGITWQCECGAWNFADAQSCWRCHEPKIPPEPKRTRGMLRKELVDAR